MPVLYRLKDTGGSRDTNVPVHSPSIVPVKRHRGGSRDTIAGTLTSHGTHKRTRGHTEDTRRTQTNLTSIQTQRHTRTTTRQPKPETAADSTTARTAAGPEPPTTRTPRGRLTQKRPPPRPSEPDPVKRHRGEPGHTHGTHKPQAHTRTHGSHRRTSRHTDHTDEPGILQVSKACATILQITV